MEAILNRPRILIPLAMILLLIVLMVGCDKERIVESSEIVHDIEYIELPPDTIIVYDTVATFDSVSIHTTDTLTVIDTVVQVNTIYDTIVQTNTIFDTVTTTVTVTDTVIQSSNVPNELVAMGALQYYVDPLVLEFISQEFGLSEGWIYYLSPWQAEITMQSTGVYDIYSYVDYWAPDWSGYYSLEFLYRITYNGGDPADVNNWTLSEPPAASPSQSPGITTSTKINKTSESLMK